MLFDFKNLYLAAISSQKSLKTPLNRALSSIDFNSWPLPAKT
jgi:hypothetical protein